ncbi:MAG: PH domain-containing protein [Bacteroidales bacterium]|jgi:hypothetical protein|nr:PH domain-containing protein [Bacteroidales bacterium]
MKKYRSKIGLGIILFLLTILGGTSILMVYLQAWPGLLIIILLAAFIIHTFLTTIYEVKEKVLIIRSGFFVNEAINIESITKISETKNMMSSPANSLDRLEIRYEKNKTIMISPINKDDFLNHMKEINSDIEIKRTKKHE